jgi:hypothetical protein
MFLELSITSKFNENNFLSWFTTKDTIFGHVLFAVIFSTLEIRKV